MSRDESERATEAGKIRRFSDERESCTPRRLISYFVRLGPLGFGGPVALANSMRHDLVERRGWPKEHEYDEGLAIATACPGPLAYQLAVYCGFIRFGLAGGIGLLAYPWLAPAWFLR